MPKVKKTPKQAISIRIDIDVIEWLKSNNEQYQTEINRLLREAMKEHKRVAQ